MFRQVLQVLGLRIERGGTVILEDVNWRVGAREHWVILGANGSGKTSLLAALTGYLMPTAGQIEVLGERYGESDWRELRCKVGIVSSSVRQIMADHEPAWATVISGRLAEIDLWREVTVAERRAARRILARVECEHLAERPWGVLSQGERQRVLIGRALMAQPKLLILDEPCAGLDPAARENFLKFIEVLGRQRSAPALVLVTHHVEEIMPAFTHVLVLRDGRVLASGRKDEVLRSAVLSAAFRARVRLRRRGGGYALQATPRRGVVV